MSASCIPLNVHSNYSLLAGAGRIEELLGRARELGYDALALTDTNGLYGAIPFLKQAQAAGVKPILGAEFEHAGGRVVCLARDRTGYSNLCHLCTFVARDSAEPERPRGEGTGLADALARRQEGLFILSPSLLLLHELKGRVAADTLFHELRYGASVVGLPEFPVVRTNPVWLVHPAQRAIHRTLTAIRLNRLISEVREAELAPPEAWLKGPEEMRREYGGDAIGRAALANSRRIADACNLDLPMGKPIFPKFFALKDIPPEIAGHTPRSALRHLACEGVSRRYHPVTEEVRRRLDYELDVIDRLHFSEYFLIVWDIVSFALRKGIPVVGRGSAANSLVAYALGITRADPLVYNLYFERFLNLSRSDCPDIDLDLCWRRRDEVLRYVYERHGVDCVAMVSNHNTYQARSAFRDVARVSGLPMGEINRLSNSLPHYGVRSIHEALELYPEARDFPIHREPYRSIVAQAEAIDGFPRHLSIHVGGIVIGDRPLPCYLPLERAPKGIVVTQYEMHAVEAVGLVKIDLLGHRSLTVIADTVRAVRRNQGVEIDLESLADGDGPTAALLRDGRTIGCFQIESPGMRSLLQMIRAADRMDVIHALSLIRPGPSGSGMKERFVRRRLGEEPTAYLDPRLADVLAETHGVMLFQEDILKVAAVIAGFTLEEGDALRQAISKKRSPERIQALRERFREGAVARGVKPPAAEAIWELIENFAGYSYCKAHAVTYGHIAYEATWLKAHYPAEFMTAVMVNQGGFYEMREYLEEARRMGVAVRPPDVNRSAVEHRTEAGLNGRGPAIRIGLGQVKGISEHALGSILRARAQRPFTSLEEFYFRTQVNDSETEGLILCGALDGLGKTRPQHLWELRRFSHEVRKSFPGAMGGLFDRLADAELFPPADAAPDLPEYPIVKRIRLEQEILGLTVTDHPLRMFEQELARRDLVPSCRLPEYAGQSVTVAGWLVTMRRAVTRNQEYMKFVTLEDRFGTMEAVLFPETYRRFGALLRSYGPYLVRGRVEQNHRAIGLTVEWMDLLAGQRH